MTLTIADIPGEKLSAVGIYEFQGAFVRCCLGPADQKRPTEFANGGFLQGPYYCLLRREKEGDQELWQQQKEAARLLQLAHTEPAEKAKDRYREIVKKYPNTLAVREAWYLLDWLERAERGAAPAPPERAEEFAARLLARAREQAQEGARLGTLESALASCREILTLYPQTQAAQQAKKLQAELDREAIDDRIADSAADFRAPYSLTLTDALQIAAAVAVGCDVFLTNDVAFQRVQELSILLLDPLEL